MTVSSRKPSLAIHPTSDPFVIETGPKATFLRKSTVRGWKHQHSKDLIVEVEPVERLEDLHVDAALESGAGSCFAVGAIDKEHAAARPSVVRVRIEISCGAPSEGQELEDRLQVSASVAGESAERTVRLIASANRVLPQWQVLREEYAELTGDEEWLAEDAVLDDPARSERDKLRRLVARIHSREEGLSALCFSGGGIRSATFNLGVLQGLTDAGVLGRFDYLSSVSGGGYVSSWLAGWIRRAGGVEKVTPYLTEPTKGEEVNVLKPEAYPVQFLRRYSNYLTPRLGVFSPDTWTIVAIVLRNLLLNWLVFVPILAAVLALPLVAIASEEWARDPKLLPWIFGAALAASGVGYYFMSGLRERVDRREKRDPGDERRRRRERRERRGHGSGSERMFLRLGLLPVLIATALLCWAVSLYAVGTPRPGFADVLPWALTWSVALPAAAFLAVSLARRRPQRVRRSLRWDLISIVLAGAAVAMLQSAIVAHWVPGLLAWRYPLYTLFAPGLALGTNLLAKTLFVALSSRGEEHGYPSALGDADREWWARWSAWTLISAVCWMAFAAVVFFAPMVLDSTARWVGGALTAGGLGGLTAWLGKSGSLGKLKNALLAVAAPLFCLVVLLLVAAGTQAIMWRVFAGGPPLAGAVDTLDFRWVPPFRGEAWQVLASAGALLAVGMAMGWFVNVNRFSLQAMYRNRLVRAYLGATNQHRNPNLFTGFDPHDNLRLHELRTNRPWPVVNIALNLVGGDELAWQERKAESFTATPLHCGSARLGYRRSQVYGGENGISVGAAVATSGAAASPNMGHHSSPAVAFIMALFNARLGTWLGNPGLPGARTYTRGGPIQSARPLVDEALGRTDGAHPYVYLSDGGHFENLGLYEMVRRRCRLIVVCDVGCDPE
jgi:hypothetical protein